MYSQLQNNVPISLLANVNHSPGVIFFDIFLNQLHGCGCVMEGYYRIRDE